MNSRKPDSNEIAARVVAQATHGEFVPATPKNRAAVALGRLGGRVGGPARAAVLTPEQRSAIAKKGAEKRWESSFVFKGYHFPWVDIKGFIFDDAPPAKIEMLPTASDSSSEKNEQSLYIVKLNGDHFTKSFHDREAQRARELLLRAGIKDITRG